MKIVKTKLNDAVILEPKVFEDPRGFFMESWNKAQFEELGLNIDFVQDNHSKSSANILRGLHYQSQFPQGKLVRVTSGKVFDVAVDLRRDSSTFGQWDSVILSAENKRIFWVPPGFAHGFFVMSETADFLYKCTELYHPEDENCICWNDEELAIDWPLDSGIAPIVSEKDALGTTFSAAKYY